MIIHVEKGKWLINAIGEAGYRIRNTHNPVPGVDYLVEDEAAIQTIIDSFDPIPFAQSESKDAIKAASVTKRLQYVTDAPGKDAEYRAKQAEAVQFEEDATVGIYMQARMTATSETAQQVADVWNAKATLWLTVGSSISAIEDKASIDIDAETDWTQCDVIAQAAVTGISNVTG